MAEDLARTPAEPALPPLLERRLVIVTGKGGTGKTTVAAALARAGARAGLRVLAAEMEPNEPLAQLLDPGAGPVGHEGRELSPGLRVVRIEPYAALGEYLGLQIGGRALVDLTLRNRSFRQLMNAAPGWRELITLGKVWHLAQQTRADETPLHELIVVDAPATGHGLTFLDVPRVVASAVRAGPLHRHAGWVGEMLGDHEHTALLPVALAEELPARETAELVERLGSEIGIAVDRVVVNAVASAPWPERLAGLPERLEQLPDDVLPAPLPRPAALARCARFLAARHELQGHWLAEIARSTGLPVVPLPYLAGGVSEPTDLDRLVPALLASAPEVAA